jgi:hypothetical protein
MLSIRQRLFENPDVVKDENNNRITGFNTTDDEPYTFGFYKEKLLIKPNITHTKLLWDYNKEAAQQPGGGRKNMKYVGRLWKKKKILSFWDFPPKEKFQEVIALISKAIGEDISQWKVDVVIDAQKNISKLVLVTDYTGSKERSEEEIQTRHLIPPGVGKKPGVPGYGSDSAKYRTNRQWQMATVGSESIKPEFYPRLYEKRVVESLNEFKSNINNHGITKGMTWEADLWNILESKYKMNNDDIINLLSDNEEFIQEKYNAGKNPDEVAKELQNK